MDRIAAGQGNRGLIRSVWEGFKTQIWDKATGPAKVVVAVLLTFLLTCPLCTFVSVLTDNRTPTPALVAEAPTATLVSTEIPPTATVVPSSTATATHTATASPTQTRTSTHTPTHISTAPPTETAVSTVVVPVVSEGPAPEASGTVTVHFIDVGQGDSTLLQGPDFTILIDAGRHDRSDVVPYLRSAGVQTIDLLIGTHPHADHIGQFPQVLQAFPVREVWMSGDEHTSRTFERALDAILASDADYHEPMAGEVFDFGSVRIEVYNPHTLTGNLHDGSISLRVTYGSVSFLFTGDAEANTEAAMAARGHDLRAQVLQVGHHGSRTSSSLPFLQRVQPEVAIYSAATGNSYGHPHAEVIERLLNLGIVIYGTDQHGTIRIVTDGSTYEVQTGSSVGPVSAPPVATPAPTSVPANTSVPPPTEVPADTSTPPPSAGRCQEGQIDINSAPREELMHIIHIGDVRVDELIRLRPFRSVDDLTRINGIAAKRLADIKEQGLACVP